MGVPLGPVSSKQINHNMIVFYLCLILGRKEEGGAWTAPKCSFLQCQVNRGKEMTPEGVTRAQGRIESPQFT